MIVRRFDSRHARAALRSLRRKLPRGATLRGLARGMTAELQHRDVTRGDRDASARIALAHLRERPDYYDLLAAIESAPRPRARGTRTNPTGLRKVAPHAQKYGVALSLAEAVALAGAERAGATVAGTRETSRGAERRPFYRLRVSLPKSWTPVDEERLADALGDRWELGFDRQDAIFYERLYSL